MPGSFENCCLVDSLRALGFKLSYTGHGPFRLWEGNVWLTPLKTLVYLAYLSLSLCVLSTGHNRAYMLVRISQERITTHHVELSFANAWQVCAGLPTSLCGSQGGRRRQPLGQFHQPNSCLSVFHFGPDKRESSVLPVRRLRKTGGKPRGVRCGVPRLYQRGTSR